MVIHSSCVQPQAAVGLLCDLSHIRAYLHVVEGTTLHFTTPVKLRNASFHCFTGLTSIAPVVAQAAVVLFVKCILVWIGSVVCVGIVTLFWSPVGE